MMKVNVRKGNLIKKKKKGWIKVIEAFLAIAMFGAALFMIIQSDLIQTNEREFIEEKQADLLMEIQMNSTLRDEVILATDFSIDSNDTAFSNPLKDYLKENKIPRGECFLKICLPDDDCLIENEEDEVYTKEVFITTGLGVYNPKKLKYFCFF